MTYAKLTEAGIVFAPRRLRMGGTTVYNPPAELLLELGYKPVIYSEAPEVGEGFEAAPGWTETEDAIVRTWTLEPEGDISDAAALEILLGGETV